MGYILKQYLLYCILPVAIKNNVLEVEIAQTNSTKRKMSPFSGNYRSQLNILACVSRLLFNILYDSDTAIGKGKANGEFSL